MKHFKQLTSLVLTFLMVCMSMSWNGMKVQATEGTIADTKTVTLLHADFDNRDNSELEAYGAEYSIFKYEKNDSYGGSLARITHSTSTESGYIYVDVPKNSQKVEIEYHCSVKGGWFAICLDELKDNNTALKTYSERLRSVTHKVVMTKASGEDDTTVWNIVYSEADGNGNANDVEITKNDKITTAGTKVRFETSVAPVLLDYITITAEVPITAVVTHSDDTTDSYITLSDALSAETTVEGDVITLKQDAQLTDGYITKKITLDLNGYTLTVNSPVTFDADIIDSSKGKGLLVCDNLMIPNNSQMPVWDASAAGYRLATVTIEDRPVNNPTDAPIEFKTRPDFGADSIHALVAGGSDASKLNVGIRLEWEGSDGTPHVKDCYLSPELLKQMYGDAAHPYGATLTLTGTDNFKNIKATPFVSSLLGVEILGDAHAPKTE